MKSMESPQWAVVGMFRRRPVPQGEILDLLSVARSDAVTSWDAPILMYDMVPPTSSMPAAVATGAGAAGGYFSPNTDAGPALRVPRYVARRIDIPPSSASEENLKTISLAPSVPLQELLNTKDVLNIDCDEFTEDPARRHHRITQVNKHLTLVTRIPSTSHFFLLVLIVFFLGEVAVVVACLTTRKTGARYVAACCLLVFVPSLASVALIFRRSYAYTSIVFHLLVWANVIMLYLQPFTSGLFFIHYILAVLTALFVLRLRGSSRSTVCSLS